MDAFLLGQEPLEDEDTAELDEPAPKKLKPAPSPLQNNSEGPAGYSFSVPIASKRYAGVRTYNGRAMIDVREFYDKDGQLAPGAKGLSMNADQWAALTAGMQPLSEALSRGDEAFFVDLGGSKRAAVSPFGGKMFIGLREYYEKDGKMLPGKKGISLPPDQWAKLCAVHEELTPKLRAAGGVPSPVKSAAAGAPQPGAAGVVSPAAGPSVPSSELKSEGAIVSIVLAPLRRAEVVEWKGKRNVDLREFYVKDGKLAHTKKGLQLTPEQFATLKERAGEVTAALKAHDAAFEVALSSK